MSVQGTSPFFWNVRRYQETYRSVIPAIPTTPNVKDGESHGPPIENLNRTVLESNSMPNSPGVLQSGGLPSAMVRPRGQGASNRLRRIVLLRDLFRGYMKQGLIWEDSVDGPHLDLRYDVLREGLPRGTEHYPGIDDDPRTKFLCAYDNGVLVGCSTLQVDSRDGCEYRIRGMAVAPEFRNRGIGTSIVRGLQSHAKERGTGIWCNARIKAITMYERCGFSIVSEVFEIDGIGLHYDMEWKDD